MSVRLSVSVRLEQLGYHWKYFGEIWDFFDNLLRNLSSIKIRQMLLYIQTFSHLTQYLAELF
jgi:hypothetical protein